MADPYDFLWRIAYAGTYRHGPGPVYHWENRHRLPADEVVIQVVDAGRIILHRPDGSSGIVGPGQAFLFRHGEASSYGRAPGCRDTIATRWVTFRGPGLSAHWDGLRRLAGWIIPVEAGLEEHLGRLTALSVPTAHARPAQVAAAIHALVAHLAEIPSSPVAAHTAAVDLVIEEILAAPFSPLSIKHLAVAHGLSREHLTRAFTARVGCPPSTWINRQRIARAIELLRATDLRVEEIACRCGLGTATSLARRLRAECGQSASDIRRQRG